jgi:hypothetical protein
MVPVLRSFRFKSDFRSGMWVQSDRCVPNGLLVERLYSCRTASISRFASPSGPEPVGLQALRWKVPLNDSTKALSVGLPGREKSIFIPFW